VTSSSSSDPTSYYCFGCNKKGTWSSNLLGRDLTSSLKSSQEGLIVSKILQQDRWKATHGTLHNCDDFMFRLFLSYYLWIRLLSHHQDNVYLSCILSIKF
jgi:hypothetical protein